MYVDLLSAALEVERGGPVSEAGLFASAMACRTRMLDARLRKIRSAEAQLAIELDYDRSLIALCAAVGIDVQARDFARPESERARLERVLAEAGVDVAGVGATSRPGPG